MSQRLTRHPSELTESARETLQELGHALREARQSRGEDLYEVAEFLRIKPSYLYALEQGDISLTPGRTYALGFIRSYADHLGFDGGEVVRYVKDALEATAPPPTLRYRTPIAESSRPGGFVLGMSIAMAAAVYGAWHVYFRDEPVMERVASVPGELGRMASGLLDHTATQPVASPGPAAPEPPPVLAQRDPVPAESHAEAPAEVPSETPAESAPPAIAEVAVDQPPAPPTVDWPAADPTSAVAAETGQTMHMAAAEPEAAGAPALSGASGDLTATFATPSATGTAARALPGPARGEAALATDTPPASEAAPEEAPSARDLLAALGQAEGAIAGGEPTLGATAMATAEEPTAGVPPADIGRVVLLAHEPSWIQVRSGDRDYVRTRTMEAGERFELPDRTDLSLWTGNAGGLEIMLDGRSLGTLGDRGRVMRNVSLAPDALKTRQTAQ